MLLENSDYAYVKPFCVGAGLSPARAPLENFHARSELRQSPLGMRRPRRMGKGGRKGGILEVQKQDRA